HFYVVFLDGREIGYVRDAVEIEAFIENLMGQCSDLYGMAVEPWEKISLQWAYRPGREADAGAVKEALRQQITLVTDAVLVVVEEVPVLPVASENDVDTVIELLCDAYAREAENVVLLETTVVEEIKGEPCCVSPEEVYCPEEVAELLLAGTEPAGREFLSRNTAVESVDDSALESARRLPDIHVISVEEVTVIEKIPFETEYTYTDSLWVVQSRVVRPGKEGSKEVVYHVKRENGVEVNREKIGETIIEAPVAQVVEKGTAATPAMGTGQFTWPVEGGGRLTQGFRGWSHSGIDISYSSHANRFNTCILAADSGVVVHTGSQYPMGNYIVIFHGRYFTVYMHNQTHFVSKGDTVSRGQAIALMGNTGRTKGMDGIHLHFEVRVNDGTGVWNYWTQHQPVDPLSFFSKN
ncbi:MAG TPA: peptidoglycan DD-metalloendopeptidase family protein, partial [Bacillota bacterium]|nr:peptidoglycan DD-metalloendopeptidase family protein [Bacillota bacterium]